MVLAATDEVVTVNVALLAPAATLTLAGTPATGVLLLVRDTSAPPDGAAAVSVTVPVEEFPPVTDVGLTLTALNAGDQRRSGAAAPPPSRGRSRATSSSPR